MLNAGGQSDAIQHAGKLEDPLMQYSMSGSLNIHWLGNDSLIS